MTKTCTILSTSSRITHLLISYVRLHTSVTLQELLVDVNTPEAPQLVAGLLGVPEVVDERGGLVLAHQPQPHAAPLAGVHAAVELVEVVEGLHGRQPGVPLQRNVRIVQT